MRSAVMAVAMTMMAALLASVPALAGETRPWGWRGDGTGRFPDADPPVKWGRISETLKGLTTQAEKPKSGAAQGTNPAVYGNVTEWLVLGPIPYDPAAEKKDLLAKEFVPGEAAMQPDLGEKVGEVEWKKIPSNGDLANLGNHCKEMTAKVFYAHAYLHSAEGGRVFMRFRGPTCRFWLNGQDLLGLDEKDLSVPDKEVELKKGWNSLTVKVVTSRRTDDWAYHYNCPPDSGFFQIIMWGRSDNEKYESDGILWEASLPQATRFSCAQPIIVGDRVVVNADPSFVICYDKMTGKRLWIDYCGHYECATAEERAAKAELFGQLDPKAKRIKELVGSWGGTVKEDAELHGLVSEVAKLMKQVDEKRYAGVAERQEAGSAGLTSVTDGKYVYTWFADGVAVCHDMDGKRKWMTLENEGRAGGTGNDHHGYQVSPILTDTEFVAPMMNLIAFDRETGQVLWKMPLKTFGWPPPSPCEPLAGEGTKCVNYEGLGLYKPGVGFFPWSKATVMGNKGYVHGYGGSVFYAVDVPAAISADTKLQGKGASSVELGKSSNRSEITLGSWSAGGVQASVLVHEGLIYTVTMGGPLRVFDEKTLGLVYSSGRLDLNTVMWAYPYPHASGVCASPALGGKYIYVFGNGGNTLVIKPGRTYEVVAKNRIERLMPGHYQGGFSYPSDKGYYPECTVSSPIFDGDRIYYQGEGFLYCIGGAGKAAPAAKPKAGLAAAAPAEKPVAAAPAAGPDGARAAEIYRSARDAERQGMNDLARQLYAKVVEGYPESSAAESARERLGALR